MIHVVTRVLLSLAAVCLGLRTTSLLIPRVHPMLRMLIAILIGGALVVWTLRLCDRYQVHDLGLGLLLSLSPVGVYDLAKWWIRRSGGSPIGSGGSPIGSGGSSDPPAR
jgi:hypothetical protein